MIEEEYLAHYGIQGQKWGVRKYENYDGTLTPEGKERYGKSKNKYGSETDPKKIEKARKIKEKVSESDDPKLVYKYRKLFTDKEIAQWKNRFNNEADILKHVPPKKKTLFEKAFDSIKKGTINMIQEPFKKTMDQFMKELFADPDADKKKQEEDKKKQEEDKKKQEDKQENKKQNKQEENKKEDRQENKKQNKQEENKKKQEDKQENKKQTKQEENKKQIEQQKAAESIEKTLALMRATTSSPDPYEYEMSVAPYDNDYWTTYEGLPSRK